MTKPLILVTNDDGIMATGIEMLAEAMREIGDVVVVAPDRERSGTSHSITLHKPLRVKQTGDGIFVVEGSPADCVILAFHELLSQKPDLVVSGINPGPNLGDDIHYSGTVAGASEGNLQGVPGLAFSLCGFLGEKFLYETAKMVSQKVVRAVLGSGMKTGLLNVNIPNLDSEKLKGIRVVPLGRRNYGDVIIKKEDPRGRPYYWVTGNPKGFHQEENTDGAVVFDGFVSVTPLKTRCLDRELMSKVTGIF